MHLSVLFCKMISIHQQIKMLFVERSKSTVCLVIYFTIISYFIKLINRKKMAINLLQTVE